LQDSQLSESLWICGERGIDQRRGRAGVSWWKGGQASPRAI